MEEKKRREIRGGYRKEAVIDIKKTIQVGDTLVFKFFYGETGRRFRMSRMPRGHVKAKYPHIMEVEMSGRKGLRKTVQYVEVLTGEVGWEGRRKYDESNYRI